jgi:hypothetical protein
MRAGPLKKKCTNAMMGDIDIRNSGKTPRLSRPADPKTTPGNTIRDGNGG